MEEINLVPFMFGLLVMVELIMIMLIMMHMLTQDTLLLLERFPVKMVNLLGTVNLVLLLLFPLQVVMMKIWLLPVQFLLLPATKDSQELLQLVQWLVELLLLYWKKILN